MVKVFCVFILVAVGCCLVSGQTAAINATLHEINSFVISALTQLTRPFNALRDDVYGHFFRSQTTLRLARQTFFSTASKFPYYQMSNNDTRQNLTKAISAVITTCIDPTVDYLQKNSTLAFFNFANDSMTPIESGFAPIAAQLQNLTAAVLAVTNSDCLARVNINSRRLAGDYSVVTAAINECIRNASATYRPPISEFTRVHFIALPFINRMNRDLEQCENGNSTQCAIKYLAKYCDNESTCKVCSTITAVSNQSQSMVNSTQQQFRNCLGAVASKIPTAVPFLANVQKCGPSPTPANSTATNATTPAKTQASNDENSIRKRHVILTPI